MESPYFPIRPSTGNASLTLAQQHALEFSAAMLAEGNGTTTANAVAKGWTAEYLAFAERAYEICGAEVDFIDWTRNLGGTVGGMSWLGKKILFSAANAHTEGKSLILGGGRHCTFEDTVAMSGVTDYTIMRCSQQPQAINGGATFGFLRASDNNWGFIDGYGTYRHFFFQSYQTAGTDNIGYGTGRLPGNKPFVSIATRNSTGADFHHVLMAGLAISAASANPSVSDLPLRLYHPNDNAEFFNLWAPVGLTATQLLDLQTAYIETLGRNIITNDSSSDGGSNFAATSGLGLYPTSKDLVAETLREEADEVVTGTYSQATTTVTRATGARDFVAGDVGKWILWAGGAMAKITVSPQGGNPALATVDRSQTIAAATITIFKPAPFEEIIVPVVGDYDVTLSGKCQGNGGSAATVDISLVNGSDNSEIGVFGNVMVPAASVSVIVTMTRRFTLTELSAKLAASASYGTASEAYIEGVKLTYKKV